MKVSKVERLDKKYTSYDLTTTTENFYINVGDTDILIHNSPALFCGTNPENGRFFVGTKGVFAKNAKLNYTPEDIDRHYPNSGLNSKLKIALRELSKLGIEGVLQGDMLYTTEDLQKKTINGKQYIIFQPNTIVYAVPIENSEKILASKIGIVFHTSYSGPTMEDMKASFTVNLSRMKKTSDVYYTDAEYKDTSGTINFNSEETKEITKVLSDAGKLFRKIDSQVLNSIVENSNYNLVIKTYNNTKVRSGEKITNTTLHTKGLINYTTERMQKEVDKVKQEKTKAVKRQAMDSTLDFMNSNFQQLKMIFDMQNLLVDAKEMIIRKLEKAKGVMDTFVQTENGYRVTQPEGFVAIDKIGNAVKLVDRLEFSRANFNAVKNWTK